MSGIKNATCAIPHKMSSTLSLKQRPHLNLLLSENAIISHRNQLETPAMVDRKLQPVVAGLIVP